MTGKSRLFANIQAFRAGGVLEGGHATRNALPMHPGISPLVNRCIIIQVALPQAKSITASGSGSVLSLGSVEMSSRSSGSS